MTTMKLQECYLWRVAIIQLDGRQRGPKNFLRTWFWALIDSEWRCSDARRTQEWKATK